MTRLDLSIFGMQIISLNSAECRLKSWLQLREHSLLLDICTSLRLQVHALLVSGGLNAALPGVLMRSQSASAMLQHQLAPLAARQAAAMLNKVRAQCQAAQAAKHARHIGAAALHRSLAVQHRMQYRDCVQLDLKISAQASLSVH